MVGAVFGSLQKFRIGEVCAIAGPVVTLRALTGLLSGLAVFLCVRLPVIASAALTKGGHDDELHRLQASPTAP
jgi:hypothetical protein